MTDTTNTITTPPTDYETKKEYIKKYLAWKYKYDAEWKQQVNKRRSNNQMKKYRENPEYREKLLKERREKYALSKLAKQTQLINCL
jgi:hypothetical protein